MERNPVRIRRIVRACMLWCTPWLAVSVAAQPPTPPLTTFARAKAERLLRDKLSCLGCHQVGGEGGRLGPSLDDVSRRRAAKYIGAMITDPQSVVPGTTMPRALMPDSERALIIRYFGGEVPTAQPLHAPANRAEGERSTKILYQAYCAGCHGATGRGDGANARFLPVQPSKHADSSAMALRSDDSLFDTIAGGGAIMKRSARMPGFGDTLTPLEIRGLVGYIRQLCACSGPAWSRDGGVP